MSESESHSVMSDSLWPHGLCSSWNSPGQNTGMGKPFPSPGNLSNPGIKPRSPALQVYSLPTELSGKPQVLWKQGYSYSIHCIPMYSHGSCTNTPSIFLKEQFPYISVIHLKKDSAASYIISITLPSKHVPQLCFLAYLVLLIPTAVRRKTQDSIM